MDGTGTKISWVDQCLLYFFVSYPNYGIVELFIWNNVKDNTKVCFMKFFLVTAVHQWFLSSVSFKTLVTQI